MSMVALRVSGMFNDRSPLVIENVCEDCGAVVSRREYRVPPPPPDAQIATDATADGHTANAHRCGAA